MSIGDVHSNERGTAARFNTGKPAFDLVPLSALADCARVFDYGRAKYAEWNWAKGQPWSVPFACLMRHMAAWQAGEDVDPESGLPHLGHAMANLVMLSTFARTYREGDDRTEWLRQPAPAEDPDQHWRGEARQRQLNTSQEIQDRLDRIPVYPTAPAAAPEDAERAAYLERWKDSPAHATHLAEGYDGRCWWHSREPWLKNPEPCVEWIGGLIDYAGRNLLGSVRCEPRPVQGVGP